MQKLQASRAPIRTQDIRTLFRAREIVKRLAAGGLESAIEAARATLVAEKSRRQYLQEVLPAHIACAVPGETETFVVECNDTRRFHLRNGSLPLLCQLARLEWEHRTQAIKVIHCSKHRQRVYWL